MNFKISDYNILTKMENVNLMFNTKSLSLVEIEDKYYDMFKLHDQLSINSLDDKLKDELYNNGFIVLEEENEINQLKQLYWEEKINSKTLHLTIMTTLECNFKCIYCFEERKNIILDTKTQESIVKYISSVINQYDDVHIDWYGGEPLLNIEAIRYISSRIISLCELNNKNYIATITTNGYNLTSEVIDELLKLKVRSAQVTIDGPKYIHDKRRILYSGKGSFNQIMDNIKIAVKHLNISLRINVDIDTIDSIDGLFKYLIDNDLKGVDLSIKGVVSAEANPRQEFTIEEKEFAFKTLEKYKLAYNLGLKPSILSIFDYYNPRFCIVDLDSQMIISPDGYIYKCGESYNEKDPGRVGRLNVDGSLDINIYKRVFWDKDPFDDKVCIECKVLPLCMGGCQMKRKVKKDAWCNPELKYQIDEIVKLYYQSLFSNPHS